LARGASCADVLPGNTKFHLSNTLGTVLEVGAGSGELLHLFSPEKIDKIYGVEPAEDLHPKLIARAEECGFGGGRYVPLKCGAEPNELVPTLVAVKEFGERRVKKGELFDTIVCVRVLCMVPNIDETVGVLYSLLKPGGKLIVGEHGVNHCDSLSGIVSRIFQWAYMMIGWRIFLGECHLDRNMAALFENAARSGSGWKEVKLDIVDSGDILPYTVGYLMK
jgi:SAM-dependent methyltransferase